MKILQITISNPSFVIQLNNCIFYIVCIHQYIFIAIIFLYFAFYTSIKVIYQLLLQNQNILHLSIFIFNSKLYPPYAFVLPFSIFSFYLKGLPLAFLVRQVQWSSEQIHQLLFIWGSLYLSFIFEGQVCWIQYSWLAVFSLSTWNIFNSTEYNFQFSY